MIGMCALLCKSVMVSCTSDGISVVTKLCRHDIEKYCQERLNF